MTTDTGDTTRQKTLSDLLHVMAALRTPVTGCPWDLAQTFATIAPYTIEEAYEVADAIDRGNLLDLKDELGDLLLQVVYHAQIAQEQGAFAFADVADAITRKMIRRHPHVFGSPEERTAGPEPGFWERLKAQERAEKEQRVKAGGAPQDLPHRDPHVKSILDDVPTGMPGMTTAVKLQDKAARVGFDWPNLGPVLDKVREELSELEAEIDVGDQAKIHDEFGDLLFVMANVARHLKVDPEAALRSANAKFTRRFTHIEQSLAALERTPAESNLEEMDALWDEAKRIEKRD